ncbi:MAG: BrnT family toxin [Zetaproteobacteria bacterium]|nr:MAG: BrnT family toxin [Zetaproteobacteria bacterium]
MDYEWDERKRRANLAKHGVDFTDAVAFVWPLAFTSLDARRDYGEPRYVSIGPVNGRLHVMVWTPRGGKVRVIGLRKANRREERWYHEHERD